jgi:hypothetical protein
MSGGEEEERKGGGEVDKGELGEAGKLRFASRRPDGGGEEGLGRSDDGGDVGAVEGVGGRKGE